MSSQVATRNGNQSGDIMEAVIAKKGIARFRIEDRGYTSPCHIWEGYVKETGYGQIRVHGRTRPAHVVAWTNANGPVPEGHDLDHLCRVRNCIRPDHLEPVTRGENLRRGIGPELHRQRQRAKTHCIRGHAYSPENTFINVNGARVCRPCCRIRNASYRSGKGCSV